MGEARSRFFPGALLVALLSPVGGPALAQEAGEVSGHVQDAQGQALQGVTLKLLKTGQEANQEQTSDAQGNFRFERLASGVYIATAAMDGYGSVTCPGVRLVAGLSRRLDIKMMPAEGEQSSSSCQVVVE